MNIFMPEETICDSVKALDDRRLIKQILECKTILDVALDETKKGYAKHPVVAYYKNYRYFVAEYGCMACLEYWYRTKKNHKYTCYFLDNILCFMKVIHSRSIAKAERPTRTVYARPRIPLNCSAQNCARNGITTSIRRNGRTDNHRNGIIVIKENE